MTIQLLASATLVGSPGAFHRAAEHVGVKATGTLYVIGDDEVGQHNSVNRIAHELLVLILQERPVTKFS